MQRLLAKSVPRDLAHGEHPPDSIYLPNHLCDVYRAAEQVLDATGNDQLRALGLDPERFAARFRRIVLFAAATHDLGKANDHFQGMLSKSRRELQGLRHEWVALLMLEDPQMRGWLLPAVETETDLLIAEWAITGHHPKYGRSSPPRLAVDGAGDKMHLATGHQDFDDVLSWLADTFCLPGGVPSFSGSTPHVRLVGQENAFLQIFRFYTRSMAEWERLSDDEKRMVAAVKDCLVAADVAGSALPQDVDNERERQTWIATSLSRKPTRKDFGDLIRDKLDTQALRGFQQLVGESTAPVTLVKGGCGTGKTLAAYEWARVQHPNRRLYLCYPTTGTATEGFRDYLVAGAHPKFHARLFHGRSDIDLEILKVRGDDDRAEADALARIESLDAWSTPIVCCTVDQVLGLVQNNRRPLYAWPALAGAAFVFDEIHAYDDRLFGALLRFLGAMRGVPVLLMTASLPAAREQAIVRCLTHLGKELHTVPGPADLETRKRYHRLEFDKAADPVDEARRELKRGGNVLWVCNTVERVMQAAERAADGSPIVYHSRFRYEDRVNRHNEVVNAFKAGAGRRLAICSQVAEVSLDLKNATLLITDVCPVPSLVQRLGRLNRDAQDGEPTRPFIVIEPRMNDGTSSCLPYTPEDFVLAKRWLDELPDGTLSQRTLAETWEQLGEVATQRPAFVPSAWLDGGPVTQVLELREASPGITVLLERDANAVRKQRRLLPRFAIPMPPPPKHLRDEWRGWRDVNGVPIVPSEVIEYDELRGARWAKPSL